MTDIRSVGGNSVAEAYYQLYGEIYMGMGKIISCLGISLCLGGCFTAGWVARPAIIADETKIDTFADDVEECVACAAQELKEPAEYADASLYAQTSAESKYEYECHTTDDSADDFTRQCANCGAPLEADAVFCIKCGTPAAAQTAEQRAEQRICPSCGKPVSVKSAFCTKCGQPM